MAQIFTEDAFGNREFSTQESAGWDAADRQWLSAIFANETGQPEPARFLATAAANAKAEYRNYLPLIAPER